MRNQGDHSVPLYIPMALIFSSNCANKILYIRSTLEYRIITPLVQAVFSPRNNFSVDIPSKDPLEVGNKVHKQPTTTRVALAETGRIQLWTLNFNILNILDRH